MVYFVNWKCEKISIWRDLHWRSQISMLSKASPTFLEGRSNKCSDSFDQKTVYRHCWPSLGDWLLVPDGWVLAHILAVIVLGWLLPERWKLLSFFAACNVVLWLCFLSLSKLVPTFISGFSGRMVIDYRYLNVRTERVVIGYRYFNFRMLKFVQGPEESKSGGFP